METSRLPYSFIVEIKLSHGSTCLCVLHLHILHLKAEWHWNVNIISMVNTKSL